MNTYMYSFVIAVVVGFALLKRAKRKGRPYLATYGLFVSPFILF